jgi:hypothetical protein
MTTPYRFDFNDRDGVFEVIENGDWVRATDYDALAAKLAKAVETISLCRKVQAQFAHTEDPLIALLDTTLAELWGKQ